MKKIILFLFFLNALSIKAQKIFCGTRPKGPAILFNQKQKDILNSVSAINTPYSVKVYVTVFADNDGNNRAETDANIKADFQFMANAFQAQNICFMLVGIKQVNNTDLNNQDVNTETSELNPYMVSGFLNVFYHKELPGYYGYAYNIPNTFLSMVGGANLRAILGHEMGHCLGLYHTFETWEDTAKEFVARTGNCKNCETNGDVLCDTPADDNGGVNASCVYIGTGTDACSTPSTYSPLTNNMMAYGDYNCLTTITNGQGERMRLFLTTNASLMPFVSQDNLLIPVFSNYTVSSGTGYTLARDFVTVSEGSANMTVNGTANYSFQAKKVLIKSGTKFSPSAGGKVSVQSNPYCN